MFEIPKTMHAAVYRGPNDLRTETVPVPRLSRHELLVKVAACGVCPTDIKKIQYGTVPPPRIFGHETAGTIVKIGGGLPSLATRHSSLRLGDRVALHHHVPCMDCHYCRHRAFAQCAQYKRTGITAGFEPAGGGFAEYVRVMPFVLPGVVKIPAKNSFEEGAMLEPVNTVLKAVNRLALLPGDNVLVAGQGPIGLMFTKLLQLRGINVLATDLLNSRLRLARQFGARWAAKPDEVGRASPSRRLVSSKSDEDGSFGAKADSLRPALSPFSTFHPPSSFRLDAAVLAVPSDAALQQAFELVRGAGQILLFAHTKRPTLPNQQSPPIHQAFRDSEYFHSGKPSASGLGNPSTDPQPSSILHPPSSSGLFPVDLSSICVDEKDLLGSYSADFTLQKEVARLVFSRRLDVRHLITHRFPLADAAAAIRLATHPVPDSLKILVCP